MINKDFSALTFQDVKARIIDHFSNSDAFKDYNFVGSRLNTLIDGLAYAALYQGTFANAALFESFLQSARTRGAVVLAAQNLGYIPASMRGASVNLPITMTYNQPGNKPLSVKIPFGFKFFGTIGDSKYEFVTFKENILTKNSAGTYVGVISPVQGKIVRQQYTWSSALRIFIRDETIDRRYIRVLVNGTEYTKAGNAARVSSADTVYYFRETLEGYTEIYFGAGTLEEIDGQPDLESYVGGLKPSVGQPVVIEYLSVKGAAANGVSTFKSVDSVPNFNVTIALPADEQSSGGGDKEDIERIRAVAPKVFESQGRCVTAQDYEAFVLKEFGSIVDAIRCWGDNTKPGYAFIAIKPVGALSMNKAQKDAIEEYLKQYNIVTISPKVVTPDYLFIEHTVECDYKVTELNVSEDELYNSVLAQIAQYYNDNITAFSSSFHVSKLLAYIDNTNPAILGSACGIRMVKEQEDNYLTPAAGIDFLNTIQTRNFVSSDIGFKKNPADIYNVQLRGTDSGKLVIGPFKPGAISVAAYTPTDFDRVGTAPNNLYYDVGTIDYVTGNIYYNLAALGEIRDNFSVSVLRLYANPSETDIYTKNGSLIVYEPLLRPSYIALTINPIL
ncbi:hypothetical protein D3C80_130030 [compost metagenome]